MKKLNLRALIRLAVNNPNEAEAGRAAIKVCKALLDQDKTILNAEKDEDSPSITAPKPKGEATIKVTENPRNRDITITVTGLDMINNSRIAKLIMELDKELKGAEKQYTYDNVRRSSEPFWRSANPFNEDYWTGFDFGSRKREKPDPKEYQTNPTPTPEDYAKGAKPYDPANPGNYSKTHPKRILKCKTCGNDVETQFVGPPQVFECADCWGKEGFGGL